MRYKISSFIMIPSFLSVIIFALYTFLRSYNRLGYMTDPITIFFIIVVTILLIILESINHLIFKIQLRSISEKEKKKILEKNEGNYLYTFYKFLFYDPKILNKGVRKIDHGFDGILELDNQLPVWWVHLFCITVVFSCIYFFSYFLFDFSDPYKEYDYSYKKQLQEIKIFEKNTPQTSLSTSSFKKNMVNEGQKLFEENCSTCHQSDGSGNIGPNLTDNYWINRVEKDLYKNIFSMIWNGSKKNPTMRAFGKTGEIKGNDIEKISSYVYFINKKIEKPIKQKDPQGTKILEWESKK
ncbi:cbb3-type cytochrome c oxidase N-terminal domain-containing protein [Blattabacterium cuenoti]|uniref:cbb3-type cytochrome c oxidase N-terminal domain-containing protein n=1 Tax=Blattabacterium cuenoti TaxID=1653831 RepID=UPI00163CA7EB|nr:cbb3-type cytochrome c oxidase N-terminal domain-containing protein [Blattabacterium cuenoti]